MSTLRSAAVLTGSSALFLLGGILIANAHAQLVRAEPAAGGNVGKAPSEVTLHFNERLEGALSSVVVRDAAGKQVDKGNGVVDKKDRKIIRVSLPDLEPGVYKVEWRAVSTDTHRVTGDFTFKVGE
jgi:methionine-rich copper-binding protein CopC